jgi:phage terminase large subunit
MQVAPLYFKLIETKKKIVVCQGGGDAAKTVTILQRLAELGTQTRDQIITVTAETIPAVKAGALTSFQRYVLPYYSKYIRSYNQTERVYYFYNNTRMEFKSFRDEASATGAERDYLFMNECNHETYETFWQAQRKTRKQVFLDYNPNAPFWVHSKVLDYAADGITPNPKQEAWFKNRNVRYITDHRHNPFLSQEDHDAYESISDPEIFRVYARGMTGKITGLIFGHFKKWTLDWPTDILRTIWGIDYGYTNDPTAITKIAVGPGRRRIGKECSYAPGIGAENIKNIMIKEGWRPGQPIFSEADPHMINQLRMIQVPAEPAIKGPGSIIAGISKVKEHECYYQGENFELEIMNWKWVEAQDIMTGNTVMTNQPVDQWNHLCDSFRMADYTDSFRNKTG